MQFYDSMRTISKSTQYIYFVPLKLLTAISFTSYLTKKLLHLKKLHVSCSLQKLLQHLDIYSFYIPGSASESAWEYIYGNGHGDIICSTPSPIETTLISINRINIIRLHVKVCFFNESLLSSNILPPSWMAVHIPGRATMAFRKFLDYDTYYSFPLAMLLMAAGSCRQKCLWGVATNSSHNPINL